MRRNTVVDLAYSHSERTPLCDRTFTLYQLVEYLFLWNNYFEGQLASVRNDVKPSQAAVESVTRKMIKAKPSSSRPMTYANKVKVDASRVGLHAIRPPSSMVPIFSPKGKQQDSSVTKRTVLFIVQPAQSPDPR